MPRFIAPMFLKSLAATLGICIFGSMTSSAQGDLVDLLDLTDPMTVDTYLKTGSVGGDFIATNDETGSSGTGQFNVFLSMQGSDGNEMGLNSALPQPDGINDDIKSSHTTPLLLSIAPIVDIGGTLYYEFLLDINEPGGGGNELISLNQVQLFLTTGDVNTFDLTTAPAVGTPPLVTSTDATQAVEFFRMNTANDTVDDYEILLDASLGNGSGTADMLFYVTIQSIIDQNLDLNDFTNIVMYSQFGTEPGSAAAQSGFEEWATRVFDTEPIPEPSSMALLSLVGLGGFLRRRSRNKAAV